MRILKLSSLIGMILGALIFFDIAMIQKEKMYYEPIGGYGYFACSYLIVFSIFVFVFSYKELKKNNKNKNLK